MLSLWVRNLVLALSGLMLTGCVVGQKIRLDSTPEAIGDAGSGHRVVVTVEDQRKAVLSGKQKPWRIGQYRAAAGIPWAVNTEGNRPLAEQIRADLEEELTSLGFALETGSTQLEVLVTAWDFTGYQNGRFWYSLIINVKEPGGGVRVSTRLDQETEIRGTLLSGAKGGFERDMPGIYANIIKSIARDNPGVLDSLRQ